MIDVLVALFVCALRATSPAHAAPASVSVGDARFFEGDSGATFQAFAVTLSAPSATDVTVQVSTREATATAATVVGPGDFKPKIEQVTIAAGATAAAFTVAIYGDVESEADEEFTIELSNPVGATLGRASATGTILNDDMPGDPALGVSDVQVDEGNTGTTPAVFTVSLAPPSTSVVTVEYASVDRSATVADGDYEATSGTLTFAAGEVAKTFTVLIRGDQRLESGETFVVRLQNSQGAKLARPEATGSIRDDEPLPEISIGDATVTEGQSGTTPAVFELYLSAPFVATVSFKYRLAAGTVDAADFAAPPEGVVQMAVGQTSATVMLLVNGDGDPEPDETFRLELASVPLPVRMGGGVGTILNDDGPVPPPEVVDSGFRADDAGPVLWDGAQTDRSSVDAATGAGVGGGEPRLSRGGGCGCVAAPGTGERGGSLGLAMLVCLFALARRRAVGNLHLHR